MLEKEEKLKDNKIYNTALYCRLSLDDGSVGESGSIQTQKIILEEYAKMHGFKIYDIYEVKTIYKEDDSKITYFVIEEVEEESIVKLIEKMLVNIILTGCNGGLC